MVYALSVLVSMKSGLEDRNNPTYTLTRHGRHGIVSMKSGLEDRNNASAAVAFNCLF